MHVSKALRGVECAIEALRKEAAPVGALHSYWDIIGDLEELRNSLRSNEVPQGLGQAGESSAPRKTLELPILGSLSNNPESPLTRRPIAAVASVVGMLSDAGIIPPHCRRVVIDLQAGDAVRVYYEVFGDKRILDVVAAMVENNTIPKLPKEPV